MNFGNVMTPTKLPNFSQVRKNVSSLDIKFQSELRVNLISMQHAFLPAVSNPSPFPLCILREYYSLTAHSKINSFSVYNVSFSKQFCHPPEWDCSMDFGDIWEVVQLWIHQASAAENSSSQCYKILSILASVLQYQHSSRGGYLALNWGRFDLQWNAQQLSYTTLCS